MHATQYFQIVRKLMARVEETQVAAIDKAAEVIADTIAKGGVLHIFGTGHSHMLGEELFYRAGGLVPVNMIFEPGLMLHQGAAKSTRLEKLPGYAKIILEEAGTRAGEPIIILSNSGINAVPVEMALEAKAQGLVVIALSSLAMATAAQPRHSSGKKLFEVADICLDNCVIPGDAVLELPGLAQKVGPISTLLGALILNVLIIRVIERLIEAGQVPPVFMSSNLPGGAEYNEKVMARYRQHIRGL
ncbi:MAG: SIS domain-containing protein [Firmicutes bacterium]|nr:SIS domain-containing protein [Bacillota bacterium]